MSASSLHESPVDYEATRFSTEEAVDLAGLSLRALKLRRAMSGVSPASDMKLLELGCGEGAVTRTLKAAYPVAEVHGCDVSAAQLRRAEERAGGVIYKLCDSTLPYEDEFFDAVFVLDVLEHLDCPAETLQQIARVLRPGGRLLLHCPCEGQPGTLHWLSWKTGLCANLKRDLAGHVQRFSHHSLLREVTRAGFTCIWKRYSFHPFGQFFDLLSFWRQRCNRRVNEGLALPVERLMGALPWYRLFPWMERVAGLESRLLARLPLAMGVDACLEKR
jgi:ubiquinone/menaquinone biosynthesis C-methylase UbiE